jgi:hypothetical protein
MSYVPEFVEVPVREKTHKYKRFAHEKRAKRTPGMKRVETPQIMVTKWDVEIANKRNKNIGRARDRADKYGNWSENLTDTMWEDEVNKAANDATKQRVQAMVRKERSRQVIRSSLAEYGELMFPTYKLEYPRYWPLDVWFSYGEYLAYNPEARKEENYWKSLQETNAEDDLVYVDL